MKKLLHKWKQYRYRFVPWLMLNLKNRSIRSVNDGDDSGVTLSEADFCAFLYKYLTTLHACLGNQKTQSPQEKYNIGVQVLHQNHGYSVERCPSILPSGGQGVKVTAGTVPTGYVTSLYCGLIYEPYDPIFFQSIGNPFIFRCADGVMIDGNDKGLSRSLFRSCRGRDSCWPLPACDESWLTPIPVSPINVGQYVNNHNKQYSANVAYQEFYLPEDFPAQFRQYLPNLHYSSSLNIEEGSQRLLKMVALVSLREINCGEELLSSYFTVVR